MAANFDLTDFRLFINIADSGSFTKGSERSFLSLPAASGRIKNLELDLQVKLLKRTPSGVVLTEYGKIYLDHARKILAQIEVLSGDIRTYGSSSRGQFSIFANATAISHHLPPVIAQFLPNYEGINIEMTEQVSEQIVQMVGDGMADVGFLAGEFDFSGLDCIRYAKSRLVIIAPRLHPLSERGAITFKEALAHDFISLPSGSATHTFIAKNAEVLRTKLNVRVQVAGNDALCRLVEQGAGIGLLSEAALTGINHYPNVSIIRLTDNWAVRNYSICAQSFANLPAFVRDFIDLFVRTHERTPPENKRAG